ncbi:MAG: hypothetical protein IMY69_06325 [Bacteroidetes bacterium]|nr:hypothetical protein [Bacteroidota bacterium]
MILMTFRKIQIFSLIGLFSLGILIQASCKKDKDEDIPYVYVNFTINPSSIEYNNLEIIGNYAYVTGGFRGIIIYHATQDDYKAYERTSPYNYPNDFECRVSVDNSGLIAVDSCSGSKYLLLDGSPFEGPATKSLKQYRTSFDGTLLHVYN